MMELLTAWGVVKTVGFVFRPVLEDLAKDATKDWAKDILKNALKNVIEFPEKDELAKAAGSAIKEFLDLVQIELEYLDFHEHQDDAFIDDMKRFVRDADVKTALGEPLDGDAKRVDVSVLATRWRDLGLHNLPDDFDWEQLGKQYARKTKGILRKSDVLRTALASNKTEQTADSVERLAGVSPGFDVARYKDAILKQYGNIDVESLDTKGYAYNKLRLWKMFIPQSVRQCHEFIPRIFEIPKEIQKKLKEKGELHLELSEDDIELFKREYAEQSPVSVLEIVGNGGAQHSVILGDPGSGKSSLLRFIALKWARKNPIKSAADPLPLLIELRTYARDCENGTCIDFLSFMEKGNTFFQFDQLELDQRLKQGNAIIMFDGLDEVFDLIRRKNVVTAIMRVTSKYPGARIFLTSRVIGYKQHELQNAGFRHYLLQDLDDDQIRDFNIRWHNSSYSDSSERERKKDRLQNSIHESKSIRELAGNPLLLTMMAILNRNQKLPRDRVELYNQASRVLLEQWDIERQLEDEKLSSQAIDFRDKQLILRQVAFTMQSSEKGLAGNMINFSNLRCVLSETLRTIQIQEPRTIAKLLIKKLRERNFILSYLGADFYAFVHRTFLEYFCAWEFVKRLERRGLRDGITEEELKNNIFANHWADEPWHEVLRLIAGMIEPEFIGKIVRHLMEVKSGEANEFMNLFLAAECLSEVRNRSTIRDDVSVLIKKLRKLTMWDLHYFYERWEYQEVKKVEKIRTRAILAIAILWGKPLEKLAWLKSRAQTDDNWAVRREIIIEIAHGWKEDPETRTWLKSRAQTDDNRAVRQAAVIVLAGGWKEDPETRTWLKSRAQTDDDRVVREAAVIGLARGWKEDPETRTWLKSRVRTDDDRTVRQAAVIELARAWKEDPEMLAWLKSKAQTDNHWDVRQAAVRGLARGWKKDPEILAILKYLAQTDEIGAVRQTAVRELARGWKEDPETLAILKSRAQTDSNRAVRQVAVIGLARGWKENPETLTILKSWAQTDDDRHVRQAAVLELARGWKEDLETLAILKSKAQTDDSWVVREAVVRELARGWKENPETLTILKYLAQSDNHGDVRQAAVRGLARGWIKDPEILAILKSRVQTDNHGDVRRAAVRELARGWKGDPETLTVLKLWAQTDDHGDVRQAAVRELARGWKENPETLTILKSRAQTDDNGVVRQAAVGELTRGWEENPDVMKFLHSLK